MASSYLIFLTSSKYRARLILYGYLLSSHIKPDSLCVNKEDILFARNMLVTIVLTMGASSLR